MKLCTNIHGLQRTNPTEFGHPMTSLAVTQNVTTIGWIVAKFNTDILVFLRMICINLTQRGLTTNEKM